MRYPHNTSIIQRFQTKIKLDILTGCWNWIACKDKDGYGQFQVNKKRMIAHRFSYRYFVGELKKGLHIDHVCRNTSCVNPLHLEQVTPQENLYRSMNQTALNKKKTHCKRGHEFTQENMYHFKGGRICKICVLEYQNSHYIPKTLKSSSSHV